MVSRTAGNDIDPLKPCQHLTGKPHFRQVDLTVLYISSHRVLHSFWLLVDLLEHEMLISAFFRGFCIPFDLRHVLTDLFPVDIIEMDLIFAQLRDLHVPDIVDIPRPVQDRGHVGSDQAAGLILPDDERAVLPRRKEPAQAVLKHHAERIGAADTQHRPCQSFKRSACLLIIIVHQFDRDLCIRLGIKAVPGFQELFL